MTRPLPLFIATAVSLLLLVSAAYAGEQVFNVKVEVSAGESTRVDTPVSVEAEVPKSILKGKVLVPALVLAPGKSVESVGTPQPGQVEILEGGKVRIWWIVENLEAGKSRPYQIIILTSVQGETEKYGTFRWKDSSEGALRSTDLLFGKTPLLRYMWTPFDKDNIELTKKPFHHVFDPDGSRLITKGAGGRYPHHRGVYFGYNRCRVGNDSYDIWHAHKGEHSVHKEIQGTITGPVVGGHTLRIDWNGRDGKTFARETRRLLVFHQSKDRCLIEFTTRLEATAGPVRLDGDRQHAGVQFRAAQHVADNAKSTRYLRPEKWADLPPGKEQNAKDYRDLPWNALQYRMGERAYTVGYLSDPENPDGADFSERLYGRFGEFIPWDLSQDNPLSLRYRLWVDATGKVTREDVARRYADLADPPKVTLIK